MRSSVAFQELTVGKMAILISHRFFHRAYGRPDCGYSRRAGCGDRSHHELLNQGGIYGHLFSLQAKGIAEFFAREGWTFTVRFC